MSTNLHTIAVLGAGTMGAGIALVAARAGHAVFLRDVEERFLARGRAAIELALAKGVELGKVTVEERDQALARVETTIDLGRAAAMADLVIEAVPEDLELKRALFREVTRHAKPDALFASNTSSLSITAIGRATDRPDRVIGLHFFNPVHVMKLLEIVVGEDTAPATLETARQFGRALGKEVITVRDSPGFATSRLGVLLGLEAIRMVEEGVASAADIDTAMTLGYGHPMGPLKLTDLVGLDVRLKIAEALHASLDGASGRAAFDPPALLRRMVEEGALGKKSGRGFYRWDG
ncbi:MAG: 3-hydroxyacyl-CoA dehydrogenase family protein [Candidatus Eisenbacteria bacterium]